MNSNKITKVLTGIFGGIFSLCFVFLFIDIIIIGFDENVDRRFDSFSKMFILLIFAVLTVGYVHCIFITPPIKAARRFKRSRDLNLWETRSRYLFDMTPLFILLTVDGMDTAKAFLDSFRKPKHQTEKQA